jgi:hypothetical protein
MYQKTSEDIESCMLSLVTVVWLKIDKHCFERHVKIQHIPIRSIAKTRIVMLSPENEFHVQMRSC